MPEAALQRSEHSPQVASVMGYEAEDVIAQGSAIRVKDSGIGIPPDMLEQVFDLFTQVPVAAEHSAGRLGIGLSLVKRLVQMHGGSVTARVATADAMRATPAAIVVPPVPAHQALRVLVVDDNNDSAESLAAFLSLAGHHTEVAFDGVQAVAAAASFDPDVVLLDIGLPKLDGFEVCRAIREQRRQPPMVIIALSGWGQEEDRRKSAAAGFDDHLLKPVDPVGLEQRLAGLALAIVARGNAAGAAD